MIRSVPAPARAVLLCLGLLAARSVFAVPRAPAPQTITGTIVGRIVDPNGAPIGEVRVRLQNLANGFAYATRTNPLGQYRVEFLPAAAYRIDADREGFHPGAIERWIAEVNRTKAIEPPPITLVPVGGAAVPASPAARLQVNAVDPAVRGSITNDMLTALPLDGFRSFDTLALLFPSIVPAPETPGRGGPGLGAGLGTAGQFSANGQRSRANNFTVDGSDNNDQDVGVRRQGFTARIPQPVDSVTEFQLTVRLSDAEAGRDTGAQVNAVTRSGTSDVHGEAYVFFTDRALNARNFFDFSGSLGDGVENPEENDFRRFQGGAAVSAPLFSPRVVLFAAFERLDLDETAELHFAVPTLAERSRALADSFDSSNVGVDVLVPGSIFPAPNNPGGPFGPSTLTRLVDAAGDGTLVTAKIDAQAAIFGRPSVSSVRYSFGDDRALVPAVDNAVNSSLEARAETHNLAGAINTTVGERESNQVRASFGRTHLDFGSVAGSPLVFDSLLGTTGPIGRLLLVPYSPVGVDPSIFPQGRTTDTFQVADTFLLTRASHAVKLGGDVRLVRFESFVDRNYRPQIAFTPGRTIGLDLQSGTIVTRTLAALDLAASGAVSDIFQTLAVTPDSSLDLRSIEMNLFVHDTWRATPRLTVTAGLRYEYNTVPKDDTGELESRLRLSATEIPGTDRPLAEPFVAAFNAHEALVAGRDRIYEPDANNLAPRVGLAWDVLGDGRLSARAGYGLYYDVPLGTVVSQSRNVFPNFIPVNFGGGITFPQILSRNPALIPTGEGFLLVPGTNQLSVSGADVPSVLGSLVFLNGFGLASTLPEKHLRTPYVHQWGASIEWAIADKYVAAVAYGGASGHKLLRTRTPNGGPFTPLLVEPLSGAVAPLFSQASRPVPQLGAVTVFESSSSANYHALDVSVSRRFAGALDLQLSYSWAHAIDDVSDVFDLAGSYAVAQDELGRFSGLRAERGNAAFDVRHNFNAAWRYELGLWKDRPLAGGYSLSGIFTARTGQPFTVSTAQDLNLDGNLTDRPITDVGIERIDDGRVRLALTRPVESFVVSDGRAEGAVGRNTFRAAAFVNLDVAFSKAFRFGDRHTAVARLEVFNAFNRAHFGIPVRVLEAPGFGSSSTTLRPARVVQFAVRYSF
jgi:hypothetical protein